MSKKLNILGDIWFESYELIRKKPSLLFPLCIVSFLEGLWLELLYFAPRSPLKAFLLPPIKRFFGEVSVHYPAFLFLVPRLFGYGQVLIYVFAGGILTAMTVAMTASAKENRPLRFSAALKKVKGRIWAFLLVSLFITTLLGVVTGRELALFKMGFGVAGKGPLRGLLQLLWRATPYLNFLIAILIQTFVVFIFPFLVLDNKKLFPAIGRSFLLGGRHFPRVYLLLLFPMVCYSPVWFLKAAPSFLVHATLFPEVILWLLGISIVVTLLVDAFVAVSATLFFLRVKHEKSG